MEQIIEKEEIAGRALTWKQLGLEASGETVKRMMGTLDYRKCIACRKGWVKPEIALRRLEYARHMLEKYPKPEDWYHVRFSDEVYFGWGPQGKLTYLSTTMIHSTN